VKLFSHNIKCAITNSIILTISFSTILLLSSCSSKTKVYHVGILSGADTFIDIAHGFKAKMTELGYIEGKNVIYDLQAVNADPDGEQRIAKKFVTDKVDLIFAFPTEAAVKSKNAAQDTKIPVVFAMAGIEGNNLVKSISQPGENITGVRFPGPDLTVKRFEILSQLAPNVKRLYIVYDVNYPTARPSLAVLHPAVASKGVTLVEDHVRNIKELKAALRKRSGLRDIGVDAILIMPETLTQSPEGWAQISRFAEAHRIPIAGSAAFEADMGAVFSYLPDTTETGRLAASLADKIFKGTPAGSIFVVTPDSRLRLNYKLAMKLGLTVNESLMSLANEVIR
jgi:putative tryptophan/tyrosine transport system substrate-binding protein